MLSIINLMKNIEDLIFDYVRLIPFGLVTTFSEIAKAVGQGVSSGYVVNVLKKIQDVFYIPSYRVVTTRGGLSKTFPDGGKRGQKKYLKNEGIIVKQNKVNLQKYGFRYW